MTSLPAGLGLADAAPADGPEHLRLVEGEHLRCFFFSYGADSITRAGSAPPTALKERTEGESE